MASASESHPAAVFVYRRRLHTASAGLSFPREPQTRIVHGFNVVLWRQEDQGFALVSDLNLAELLNLQQRIAQR